MAEKSETVRIAEEIGDAVVALVGKISPHVPADCAYTVLSTAQSIALAAYSAAHPDYSHMTASTVAAMQESKENN